jgi:Flp pilus assembly protein TadB
VTGNDGILVGALALPASIFLCRGIHLARSSAALPRAIRGYGDLHSRITRKWIESGFLPLSGIALADPIRCWAAAEAAALAILASGFFLSRDPAVLRLAIPMSFAVGAAVLYLSLRSRCAECLARFRDHLPLAAFQISLLMESGLGPVSAMKEAAEALPPGECSSELREILQGRNLGIPPAELFDASQRRVPLEEYASFLNLIRQGEKLGVGLSKGLSELSDRILEAQAHRAETAAQQAAVKMLLPLVLFIFPAVFLIVLSPVILNLCAMAGW